MSQFEHVRGGTTAEKEAAVEAVLEKDFKWVSDEDGYGKREYYAAPIETIAKKEGDCEDLAILKYYALRWLDVPADKMYLVRVDNTKGEAGGHLTLMVDTSGPARASADPRQPKPAPPKAQAVSAPPATADFAIKESYSPVKKPTPETEAQPGRKSYKLYYAMNENGFWRTPAADSAWDKGTPHPAACIPGPKEKK
jgi:hypothetical protein